METSSSLAGSRGARNRSALTRLTQTRFAQTRFAHIAPGWSAIFGAPWAIIAACVLFSLLFPGAANNAGAWVMLASGVLLGMPHGACDLWALCHLRDARGRCAGPMQRARLAKLVALYIAAAVATMAVWALDSGAALVGFLAITVWHFGNGDAWLWAKAPGARALLGIGRGLLVISAPLALRPAQTQEILYGFAALSGDIRDIQWLWTIAPFALGAGLLLQLAGQFWQGGVTSQTSALPILWSALWLESALLLALFAAAPPLLAISCYFMGVHALRHLLRLEVFSGSAQQTAPLNLWNALRKHHRHSLFLSAVTLVGLLPVLWLWPQLSRDALAWSMGYLVLVSSVTTPHALLVFWLERAGKA